MSFVSVIFVRGRTHSFAFNCLDLKTEQISMAEGNTSPHEMSSEKFHEIETECSDAAPVYCDILTLLHILAPALNTH